MSDVSLILPTYNERGNIDALIRRIYATVENAEVIVVDDNSPDGTWHVVETLQGTFPGLKLLRRMHERGLRTAIQAGLGMARGEYVGWLDCDLSMPPELFTDMVARMEQADIVLGSRYVEGGKDDRPFLRRASSLAINGLGRVMLGTRTLDLTSGFLLCRKYELDRFPLAGGHGEYCIALLFRGERAGLRILEVPYVFRDRESGESKSQEDLVGFFLLGLRYVLMILGLFRERVFS